jgi:hypothetical protein
VKDKNGDLLRFGWKNYSQLLNIYSVGNVQQIDIHTHEKLVLDPFEEEIVMTKLKKCIS